jgi:hypothetical protein
VNVDLTVWIVERRFAGKLLHRFKFVAPGTTFLVPGGAIDELRWEERMHRVAVAIHPSLLFSALDESAHESDIELTEHWNWTDRHIRLQTGAWGAACCIRCELAYRMLTRFASRRSFSAAQRTAAHEALGNVAS